MNEIWNQIAAESILKNTHGATNEEIADAEKQLGLSFAADYREFLSVVRDKRDKRTTFHNKEQKK